ncbi:MAG: porin [Aquabacterium sp.]
MKKNLLTSLIAAGFAMAAGLANAQSSVTIYGLVDVALDNVHKEEGRNIFGGSAAGSTVTRVSPSISAQSMIGFKGVEDLGQGYKASFVLEGQFSADTGAQNGQDSRMWGRQAYVGLTTPVGEVRLGRQYASIFYAFASSTVEAIGAADLMASGLIVNNLQVRQDNQVSYWIKTGGLTGSLSYATNAGVGPKISPLRVGTGGGTAAGEIVGGASAGTEDDTGRGRSFGAFANYAVDSALTFTAGYHFNNFGNSTVVSPSLGGATLMALDKFHGLALGAKYTLPSTGTVVATNFHQGNFSSDVGQPEAPKIQTITFGFKHPIEKYAVGAEAVYSRFTNFTKGKDVGVMLAGDYNASKRTKLYARVGVINDIAGTPSSVGPANIVGGPLPVLTSLGSVEVPFFAGGSANVGATTRVMAVGLNHSF